MPTDQVVRSIFQVSRIRVINGLTDQGYGFDLRAIGLCNSSTLGIPKRIRIIVYSLAIGPVAAGFEVDFEGYGKGKDAGHFLADEVLHGFEFVRRDVEDEFVVDLEEHFADERPPHPALSPRRGFTAEAAVDVEHGELH